jgi:sortase A
MGTAGGGALRSRVRARPRRRTSVIGVIGELLITAGIIVMLYVVWQLWVGDLIYGAEAKAESEQLSQQWAQEYEPPASAPTGEPEPAEAGVEPVLLPEPADAEVFGIMRIPRLGSDYAFQMAGGTSRARTLDKKYIGHYPGTSMPGQSGNFAVAAHRTTYGAPFNGIAKLHVGDAIVVETPAGWYTYRFRTLDYVTPTQTEVLLPVPAAMDVPAGTPYITMTSCSPMFSLAERIVAYGVFESFTPIDAGPPASLQAVV